jgi:putative ABC transport system ATP-binding protein
MIATSSMPDERPSVRVAGLNHSFGRGELRKQVLFENRLELAPGEIVIMTGPSGSGKTTLLTLIGALRTVQEGELQVLGQEMSGLAGADLVRMRLQIGFIFQAHNLFPSLSAMQNVRMALEAPGRERLSRAEMHARGESLLGALGLGQRLHYKPGALSGGQRQRVAIARALVARPRLVLADEPTAALDKQSGRDAVDLLKRYAKENGATIMMVTHDNRILDVADRIVNMVDGRVISNVAMRVAAEICEFLRKSALFSALTPQTLTFVADRVVLEQHAAGATIVRQGEPGDKFYIIRAGQADVTVRDGSAEKSVATLAPGDFFGEAALMRDEPRNATVTAREPLELYALGKEDFRTALESSSPLKEELRKAIFARQ